MLQHNVASNRHGATGELASTRPHGKASPPQRDGTPEDLIDYVVLSHPPKFFTFYFKLLQTRTEHFSF